MTKVALPGSECTEPEPANGTAIDNSSFKIKLLFKSKRSADMNDNYTRFIVNILRIDKWVNFFYKLHYGISFLSKSTPHGPLIWIQ